MAARRTVGRRGSASRSVGFNPRTRAGPHEDVGQDPRYACPAAMPYGSKPDVRREGHRSVGFNPRTHAGTTEDVGQDPRYACCMERSAMRDRAAARA